MGSNKIGKKLYCCAHYAQTRRQANFPHPMLLLTNRTIENGEDAKNVYHAYIMRFKIEIVLSFLNKTSVGKLFKCVILHPLKICSLLPFLVGYFKELQETLQKHPLAQFICKIAHSKGKVTVFSCSKDWKNCSF